MVMCESDEEGTCSQVSFMSVVRVKNREVNEHLRQYSGMMMESSCGNNDDRLSSDFSYLEKAGIYVPR